MARCRAACLCAPAGALWGRSGLRSDTAEPHPGGLRRGYIRHVEEMAVPWTTKRCTSPPARPSGNQQNLIIVPVSTTARGAWAAYKLIATAKFFACGC